MNTEAEQEHSRSEMKSNHTIKGNSHGVSSRHKGRSPDGVGELNPTCMRSHTASAAPTGLRRRRRRVPRLGNARSQCWERRASSPPPSLRRFRRKVHVRKQEGREQRNTMLRSGKSRKPSVPFNFSGKLKPQQNKTKGGNGSGLVRISAGGHLLRPPYLRRPRACWGRGRQRRRRPAGSYTPCAWGSPPRSPRG